MTKKTFVKRAKYVRVMKCPDCYHSVEEDSEDDGIFTCECGCRFIP